MYALTCALATRLDHQTWDLISGLLYQFHSVGIEEGEEPAPEGEAALHAANEFEHAIEPGVLLPPERFVAYFENRRDAEHAQRAIEPVLTPFSARYALAKIEEKDYSVLWRENFQPMDVPPFWRVRASWHAPLDRLGVHELVIEPGMAFGTGSHETTRGCLELMAEACAATNATRVLDFGCGSGILAIGLKKLGIPEVVAVDIDPLAINATHENAARNAVTIDAKLAIESDQRFEGIVANILKNTLIDFAPAFKTWLKPKGFLILSGLLGEQENTILAYYTALGFSAQRRISANNWVSLLLQRE